MLLELQNQMNPSTRPPNCEPDGGYFLRPQKQGTGTHILASIEQSLMNHPHRSPSFDTTPKQVIFLPGSVLLIAQTDFATFTSGYRTSLEVFFVCAEAHQLKLSL
ncbi:hypothetical protein GOP47_0023160 [Adiantum capillus-veneris]|uniref:Uncharacterized protein n=1 Tax=Adiantum capillus-veneris TaxID=13818 RepID=A0A9D4Z7K9_ADICA|nr:hypothetical protein GOP47_0023160 [Adiantum capillus-veneris]